MAIATITSKGQVTIPKDVRDALHLEQGDRVEFVILDDGTLRLVPRTRSLSSLIGVIETDRHATDAEIAKAIREGWSGR